MTSSVIAAVASTSRIAPWLRGPQVGHRDHRRGREDEDPRRDADHAVQGRRAGRSPGCGGQVAAQPVGVADRRPGTRRRPACAARRGEAAHPSGPGDTTINARNAISAIPSRASSVSIGTCFPRVRTAPGRVRASYPGRPKPATAATCRIRCVASPRRPRQRGPRTIGGARRHRGAGGHRLGVTPQRLRTVSASPTGSSASSGAGTRTSRSRARPGSCAAARRGTGAARRCPRPPPPRGCRSCPP